MQRKIDEVKKIDQDIYILSVVQYQNHTAFQCLPVFCFTFMDNPKTILHS